MTSFTPKQTPTPHIDSAAGAFAPTVLMPGDPLRAQYIADNFLEAPKQVNGVRGMLGYTGHFQGQPVSVMGSGMGMASIGIYSFELFSFYGVKRIIRVGSCGAYSDTLDLYDVLIAKDAWSESSFAKTQGISDADVLAASPALVSALQKSADNLHINTTTTRIHSSDVFYRQNFEEYQTIRDTHGCLAVEMEAFALFANAQATGQQAACIVTVSDSLVSQKVTTSKERETAFTNMMKIALGAL